MRHDVIEGEARALRQVVRRLERAAKTTPVPRRVRAQIVGFAARATAAGWRLPAGAQGPFVMNRPEEIRQAILDYQGGKMGRLSASKWPRGGA
jgi:redox-sensitive bicupin YhaK (pirin superfamily)